MLKAIILSTLTMYISALPNNPNKTVLTKLPEKAIIKARKSIIILTELQPSIIRET